MSDSSKMPNTLSDWQEMFKQIYGGANRKLSPKEIWLHIAEEAGEVAKDMRKEDYTSLSRHLPDVFAWLCGFANRVGVDLEEAVWKKYPRVCPYCENPVNCVCIAKGHDTFDESRLTNWYNSKDVPETFDEWVSMFQDIYGNVNKVLSRAAIGFHLMEEIGEVARVIRSNDSHSKYGIEIADVFAWLIAIPMKIPEIDSLDKITWEAYRYQCKRCEECPCRCKEDEKKPRL